MDLRRVAHDPVWVITGVLTDIRGELFIAAGIGAMVGGNPSLFGLAEPSIRPTRSPLVQTPTIHRKMRFCVPLQDPQVPF